MYFPQAFGVSVEELEKYVANGILNWGEPVRTIMEDGELAVNQARSSERTPLVTMLLSGKEQKHFVTKQPSGQTFP